MQHVLLVEFIRSISSRSAGERVGDRQEEKRRANCVGGYRGQVNPGHVGPMILDAVQPQPFRSSKVTFSPLYLQSSFLRVYRFFLFVTDRSSSAEFSRKGTERHDKSTRMLSVPSQAD